MKEKEGRRTKTDIIIDVLNQIRIKEKTIGEIAKDLNTNWESVRDAIGFLKKIGHVKDMFEGSDKKYIAIRYGTEKSKIPTYFKLPVIDKVERFAGYVFYKITEIFKEKFQTMPTTTQLQKISVEIFEDNIAKKIATVPTGWYRYGKISIFGVRQGDIFDEYQDEVLDKNIGLQNVIKNSVEIFSNQKKSYEIRKAQYEKENKLQYLTVLELENLQYNFINLNTSLNTILNNFDKLIRLIPDKAETRAIIRVCYEFRSLLTELISKDTNLNDFRTLIYDSFSHIWDAVATYNFYESLIINNYYQRETLEDCILADVWLKQFIAQSSLEKLREKAVAS